MSWRDQILKEFAPKVTRLTLVADPDGLLLEEGILEGIRDRGFELIPFEDHIAFRYAYETKFRSHWDRGESTDLVVVLRSQASDLGKLPYDLLQAGRKLAFNLGDIFPNLSYPVIAALDRSDLDSLYEAQTRFAPDPLGENATKDFILRHVFEIAPELLKKTSDLMRILLRRHYRNRQIPANLDERLIQILRQTDAFNAWPLESLVPEREAFFAFLQEQWKHFLDRLAATEDSEISLIQDSSDTALAGLVDLPFDHDDIRVYIDNLFIEGMLQPIPHEKADVLSKTWAGVGVQIAAEEDSSRRLRRLLDNLRASLPGDDARHADWLHFARGWAEFILLWNEQPDGVQSELRESAESLRSQVDLAFNAWLLKRYSGLVNLPPVPPVMLHHIPRFLSRQMEEHPNVKVALLLVDGLALDQWAVVRDALNSAFRFREQAFFAWVPSLTSVSRQAAFAGMAPIFFSNSIQSTDKEPGLWSKFWLDRGFAPNEVAFIKGLGDGGLDGVSEAISHPKLRIVGLVVDKVDKIMHGMELGTAGMHNQVRQWAERPYLQSLLTMLLQKGFLVFLTSDHGNVEAVGCGSPAEGAVADLRGERVRVYSDLHLRGRVKTRFPEALEWSDVGLPENYHALLAPVGKAFIQENKRTVSHGGTSIQELIVPLVQIEMRDDE